MPETTLATCWLERARRIFSVAISVFVATHFGTNLLATDYQVSTDADSVAGSLRNDLAVAQNGDNLIFQNSLDMTSLANGGPLTVNSSVTFLDNGNISGITLSDSHAYSLAQPLTINWLGTLTMSGNLSSSGSLVKQGAGTLVLSGTNTYSGGTLFQNGAINIQNNSALGTGNLTIHGQLGNPTLGLANGINLGNNIVLQSGLIVNANSGSSQLSGNISDGGNSYQLNKTGNGELILSGNNSFGGGVYVSNDCTIRAASNTAFGTGQSYVSGQLTLDLANGVNLSNSFLLGNHLAVNVDTGIATLSGLINETNGFSAPFNKTGSGTLILSGTNQFDGLTTVSAGELQVQSSLPGDVQVNSSATLSGTGTVGNVTNDGTIRPGGTGIGTLTVNGNFTQNSSGTTEIQINSAGHMAGVNNGLITVNQQANLDGTLKVVAVGGGGFQTGTQYTILNATNGVSGQFANVTSNLSLFNVGVTYNSNDVIMQLQGTGGLQSVATTRNQAAVGTALENISLSSTGSLFTMINSLGSETAVQQRQDLNQLDGEIFGTTQTIGLQAGDLFQRSLNSRIVGNGQFLSNSPIFDLSELFGARGQSPSDMTRTWASGYGTAGHLRSDGNAAATSFDQGGLAYGVDLGGDETGMIGITGGNSYVTFNDGYAGKGQLTSYQTGLYALKQNELAYVFGTATYGYDTFSTNRIVTAGGTNQSLNGNFAANQFGAYAETGLKLEKGWVTVQPLFGLQYLYLAQQGFSESGGPAALSVSSTQANALRTNLGARLIVHRFKGPLGAVWTPYWHGRWVSELLNDDRLVNASFGGVGGGGTFATHGNQLGTNYAILGKGFAIQLNDRWSLFANYDQILGARIKTETGSGGLVYIW